MIITVGARPGFARCPANGDNPVPEGPVLPIAGYRQGDGRPPGLRGALGTGLRGSAGTEPAVVRRDRGCGGPPGQACGNPPAIGPCAGPLTPGFHAGPIGHSLTAPGEQLIMNPEGSLVTRAPGPQARRLPGPHGILDPVPIDTVWHNNRLYLLRPPPGETRIRRARAARRPFP